MILDVADRIYDRVEEALSVLNLSYPKYEVLKHLLEAGDAVSLGALAEGQSCARSNITQLVDRLEADGLVRRVADPEDRRSVRAELTHLGVTRAQEGKAQMDQVIGEYEAPFTAEEREELSRMLSKLL